MLIRTAIESDVLDVRGLLVETWHDTYDAIYGAERVTEITNDWHSIASLHRRLVSPRSRFLVAENGPRIVGMAFASLGRDNATVLLSQLYVRPSFQGSGMGTALLEEIRTFFAGARRIELEVEGANTRAINFYRTHGFVDAGSITADPNEDVRTIFLAIDR